MATRFALRDQHQASITKILKIRRNAEQIILGIWEPIWLNKVYRKLYKITGLVLPRPVITSQFFVKVKDY